MPKVLLHAAAALAAFVFVPALAWGDPGYLRTPDLYGETVVFAAEGDLWTAALSGGAARRLTIHDGGESLPSFGPDGTWIAFTGYYDGNPEVYVVPTGGGEPRRLTFHPAVDEVTGVLPDGRIVFRSTREEPHGRWELFAVKPAGGEPEKLPLGWAGRMDADPESGLWAFNRTLTEGRTWKRYRGGTAQNLWIGDPKKKDFRRATDFDGLEGYPMWHGGRLYYLCDQGGTANLWSMKADGSDRQRHTQHADWDARFPAMGPDGRIVYGLAGDLRVFDPRDGSDRALAVDLPSDRHITRVRYPNPSEYATWMEISPDGERVLYVSRGEVFSVPADDGVTLPLSRGSGARENWASFSPDGETVMWVTDAGGEESIAAVDAWARKPAKTIKKASERGWHLPPRWSGDGKFIAWGDDAYRLWVAPADGGGAPRQVDQSEQWEITDYAWSPDGRWLAYSKADRRDFQRIWVYDVKEGRSLAVTGPNTSDWGPSWDPEGRWLWFLGERTINPHLGNRDFEYVTLRSTKPYALLLRADSPNPFLDDAGLPPELRRSGKGGDDAGGSGEGKSSKNKEKSAEVAKDKSKGKDRGKDGGAAEPAKPIAIDFAGIESRVVAAPIPAGNYGALVAAKERIYFVRAPVRGMKEEPEDDSPPKPDRELVSFELEDEELKTVAGGIAGYDFSRKSGKLLLLKGPGELYVVDHGTPVDDSALGKGKLDLSGVVVELDPKEEWRQIFYESWRHMRDFHWDPAMTGIPWAKLRDQYASLLPRVATRGDLQDLVGELIGELATSHTYVWGGDNPRHGDGVGIGLLGADLVREGDGFRVARIYRGDPADGVRSPLQEPGSEVKTGEYIVAVNHQPLPADRPFLAALQGLSGKSVLLSVNSKPVLAGARDVVVQAMDSEQELRYVDWVRSNREHVAEKSGGKLGYLHIPDMSTDGLVRFDTWFHPQLDKEGLVVDARWNRGGFVSQLIIERLRRKLTSFDRSRGGGVWTYPARVVNGPFVVLTNEYAGSDGDIFPATIQAEGLAPVIGMRSWGGVIGIRADKRMVDGGTLTQPEFAFWGLGRGDGWTVENHGVDPDIEVQNLPQELAAGIDAQLDRGIEELLRLRAQSPPVHPRFESAPDKSRRAFEDELKPAQ